MNKILSIKHSIGFMTSKIENMYSFGISFAWWECTETISFRIHILNYKIVFFKSYKRNVHLDLIFELI